MVNVHQMKVLKEDFGLKRAYDNSKNPHKNLTCKKFNIMNNNIMNNNE